MFPKPGRVSAIVLKFVPVFLCLIVSVPALFAGPVGTFSISPEVLEKRLAAWKAGDVSLKPAVERLVKEADQELKRKPLSVMDKTLIPPGGDKHDYYSFGIYWWPDPSKPDGLPYIRKDGERNPTSREGNDAEPFVRTNGAVETLSLAWYFTGKEVYAEKAAELIRVWYLNPETRMNPNMNRAQAIPGRSEGRSTGLIEATSMTDLIDGVALIRSSEAWTDDDDAAMTKWFADFHGWLLTSPNGLQQEKSNANLGTYYDALASHLALHLGKKDEARERLQKALSRRIDVQIKPDGTQPHELTRTISFSYTIFNLQAFLQLATLGESVGVDFWKHRGPEGQSLKGAVDLMVPYADPAKEWTLGKQIKKVDRAIFLSAFQQALRYEENPVYREVLEKYGSVKKDERWRLTK